ncbi:MAG: hypothetical protein WBA74_03285 [Cyclobacteriaceae bacterium]
MKKKFVLTKNSFNSFRGLDENHMGQLKGGLVGIPSGGPYIPTGGGGGGDDWLPVEHAPSELEIRRCIDGYRWDNVLNECVKA